MQLLIVFLTLSFGLETTQTILTPYFLKHVFHRLALGQSVIDALLEKNGANKNKVKVISKTSKNSQNFALSHSNFRQDSFGNRNDFFWMFGFHLICKIGFLMCLKLAFCATERSFASVQCAFEFE